MDVDNLSEEIFTTKLARIPSLDELKAYGDEQGYTRAEIAEIFMFFCERGSIVTDTVGWDGANAEPILNWKAVVKRSIERKRAYAKIQADLTVPSVQTYVPSPVTADDIAMITAMPVSPMEFYRTVFRDNLDIARERNGYTEREGHAYNGIMLAIPHEGNGRVLQRLITDDLEAIDIMENQLAENHFCICPPITYAGLHKRAPMARYIYAIAVDVDALRRTPPPKNIPQGLIDLAHQWTGGLHPRPTFLVRSGSGVHLYYVLAEPLPMYPDVVESLKRYKTALTLAVWNRYITDMYKHPQIGSIHQSFRMPGSRSKTGDIVQAYRVGDVLSVDELNDYPFVRWRGQDNRILAPKILKDANSSTRAYTLEETRELFPDWYQLVIVEGKEAKGCWTTHRGLYDWWLNKIKAEATVGHRYWCIMYLAVYASKADILYDELERDAYALIEPFAAMTADPTNAFTELDVKAALRGYNDKTMQRTRIETISLRTGISIERNKRNGLKQADHLELARDRKRSLKRLNLMNPEGRPTGSVNLDRIKRWRAAHPNGRQVDCIKETGIARSTVYANWAAAKP